MSGPGNVLAVMDTDGRAVALAADSCVGLRQKQWQAHLAAHDEARAAVAELIEALRKIERAAVLGQRYHNTGPGYTEEIERLATAALARMGAA